MKNPKTKEKCNIKRMIIAYKRPMNLGNLLSHRNLGNLLSHRDLATGPLSHRIYITRDMGGLCVCVCVCVCVCLVCVCA